MSTASLLQGISGTWCQANYSVLSRGHPKCGLIGIFPQNTLNSSLGIIVTCPDDCPDDGYGSYPKGFQDEYKYLAFLVITNIATINFGVNSCEPQPNMPGISIGLATLSPSLGVPVPNLFFVNNNKAVRHPNGDSFSACSPFSWQGSNKNSDKNPPWRVIYRFAQRSSRIPSKRFWRKWPSPKRRRWGWRGAGCHRQCNRACKLFSKNPFGPWTVLLLASSFMCVGTGAMPMPLNKHSFFLWILSLSITSISCAAHTLQ